MAKQVFFLSQIPLALYTALCVCKPCDYCLIKQDRNISIMIKGGWRPKPHCEWPVSYSSSNMWLVRPTYFFTMGIWAVEVVHVNNTQSPFIGQLGQHRTRTESESAAHSALSGINQRCISSSPSASSCFWPFTHFRLSFSDSGATPLLGVSHRGGWSNMPRERLSSIRPCVSEIVYAD